MNLNNIDSAKKVFQAIESLGVGVVFDVVLNVKVDIDVNKYFSHQFDYERFFNEGDSYDKQCYHITPTAKIHIPDIEELAYVVRSSNKRNTLKFRFSNVQSFVDKLDELKDDDVKVDTIDVHQFTLGDKTATI